MSRQARMKQFIYRRSVFERILFAQCWEDPAVDREALRVRPGETVLSVTSGGCNTLALTLAGPARVVAVDLNASQNYLLALKIAALKAFDSPELHELAGVVPSNRRAELYEAVRRDLPDEARRFWDENGKLIRGGLLGCGRYERYLHAFRRIVLLVHGRRTVEALFEDRDREGRARFYRDHWDTPAWRGLFRIFFSRTVLGRAGLDPAFFTYVEDVGGFGGHFLELARHAMVDLDPRRNPFLAWALLRRYPAPAALPFWLQPDNHALLRARATIIEPVTAELGEALAREPADSIDAFNLSNVFEWVPADTFAALHEAIFRVARPGARLCYRNLLVNRSTPPEEEERFTRHPDTAARLLTADRSFVYRHLEIATIAKTAADRKDSHEVRAIA